jgi:putative ribosome biogenesis GTPase RsgA
LKEKKLLAKLEGFPRKKKVAKTTSKKAPKVVKKRPKKAVKSKRVISAEEQARRTQAIDRALVSAQEHEMKQVLGFHKKRQTAENVEKLRAMLKQFKSAAGYKPKNRENFYRYLKEKKLLAKLEGFPRSKKVVATPKKIVKPARKMSAAEKQKRSMALDRALVSAQPHEMRQILSTHNKKQSARNVEVLQKALIEFKKSRGYKPKNRINFYRYLDEKDWMRRLHNR